MIKGFHNITKVVIILILLLLYTSKNPIYFKFEESTYFTTWATSIYALKNYHKNLSFLFFNILDCIKKVINNKYIDIGIRKSFTLI